MKTKLFHLERFHRYGVLKNVQLLGGPPYKRFVRNESALQRFVSNRVVRYSSIERCLLS